MSKRVTVVLTGGANPGRGGNSRRCCGAGAFMGVGCLLERTSGLEGKNCWPPIEEALCAWNSAANSKGENSRVFT